MSNKGNIILSQIVEDTETSRKTGELVPKDNHPDLLQSLVKDQDNNVYWTPFQGIELFNDNGRIGIGRMPLYSYKLDIATDVDKRTTALHIGDGKFGFSLGNGTNAGFLPEIIGVGKDENDAGLYFIGVAGNEVESTTPLIIFDGRNMYGKELINRPILGVTSGTYDEYDFLIDAQKNVHVSDLIVDNESLKNIIKELREEIQSLKAK